MSVMHCAGSPVDHVGEAVRRRRDDFRNMVSSHEIGRRSASFWGFERDPSVGDGAYVDVVSSTAASLG